MRTIKRITIPAQKAKERQVQIFVCDFCGKESHTEPGSGLMQSMGQCCICKRHCCRSGREKYCAFHVYPNGGDYADIYCPICYALKFQKYKAEETAIEKEYESKLEALEEKIRAESSLTVPKLYE